MCHTIRKPLIVNVIQNMPLILNSIIIWQGKSERSDWFSLGQDFAVRTVSMETVISCVFFVFNRSEIYSISYLKLQHVPLTFEHRYLLGYFSVYVSDVLIILKLVIDTEPR